MIIKQQHLKSDLKLITRDPIILILYVAPLLLLGVMLLAIKFLPIYLREYFNVLDYITYILAGTLGLTSSVLGIATGFMMIDDKDGKIYELMQITPLGRKGYLMNRLFMPGLLTIIYASLIIFFIQPLTMVQSALLLIMCFIQSALFAIALFHLAEDQVKGLTYAKGLNIMIIFVFTKLINNNALNKLAFITPTYWLTEVVQNNDSSIFIIALLIHFIWLGLFIYSFIKRKN